MASKTTPRREVINLWPDFKSGELPQKEFADDLYDVVMGRVPSLYRDSN